ncbi:hypothetical protein ABK040_016878 [Willaertia magna]
MPQLHALSTNQQISIPQLLEKVFNFYCNKNNLQNYSTTLSLLSSSQLQPSQPLQQLQSSQNLQSSQQLQPPLQQLQSLQSQNPQSEYESVE